MPFKNKAEKRKYIEAHRDLLKLFKIELNDELLEKMVNDTKKEERYKEAKKVLDARVTEEKRIIANDYIGEVPLINEAKMKRLVPLFFDSSGTPQAEQWNQRYKSILQSEDGPKYLFNMAVGYLLNFDDSILTSPKEEIYKKIEEEPMLPYLLFSMKDLHSYADTLKENGSPEEKAIANAFSDKYLLLQGLDNMICKYRYEATKLSTILPDNLTHEQLLDALDYLSMESAKLDGTTDPEKKEKLENYKNAFLELSPYEQSDKIYKEYDDQRAVNQKLVDLKLMGKEGIYHRAYKETPKGKEYIDKFKLFNAIEKGEDIKGIKVEEVPPADRKAIDNFTANAVEYGCTEVFNKLADKQKMIDTFKSALLMVPGATEEKINNLLHDISGDDKTIASRNVFNKIKQVENPYAGIENAGLSDGQRMIDGMYINGDAPEIKAWNENVKYLSQTQEGVKQLAEIAAKKLLQIDVKAMAEMNQAEFEKYMLEHPLETSLAFISKNIYAAYSDTIPEAERANHPVIRALNNRRVLCENFGENKGKVLFDSSPFVNLMAKVSDKPIEEFSAAEILAVHAGVRRASKKSPEASEMSKSIIEELGSGSIYYLNVKESPDRKNLKDLIDKGIVGTDNNIYQQYKANVPKLNDKNEVIGTEEKFFTMEEMIKAISEGKMKAEDFKSEPMLYEDTKKIKEFMDRVPDKPSINLTDEEKAKLDILAQQRTITLKNSNNFTNAINHKNLFSEEVSKDPEFAKIFNQVNGIGNTEDRAQILKDALEYVNTHREFKNTPLEKAKMEIELAAIAVLDGECAKKLVYRINAERSNHFFKKPEIDLNKIMKDYEITPGINSAKDAYSLNNPLDKRLYNVRETYLHLRDDLDPWYHKNGEDYKKMMQSMKNVLDYASTSRNLDSKVIEDMLKDVSEKSSTYLSGKDASTSLGQNRKSAALAVVAALDPKKAESLMGKLTNDKKEWAQDLFKKIDRDPTNVTTRDIMRKENLTLSLKDKELVKVNDEILATERKLHDDDMSLSDKIDLMAEYIVKKRLYNRINSETEKKTIENISKKQVVDTSVKLLKSDMYDEVISNVFENANVEKGPDASVEIDPTTVDRMVVDKMQEKMQEQKQAEEKAALKEKTQEDPVKEEVKAEQSNPIKI